MPTTEELRKKLDLLKQQKHAIVLAHYYVPDEVQQAADYIGDSFYLSKVAAGTDADIIVFAGVMFMGESAKMLSPDKKVLLPDDTADCKMAHMATIAEIQEMRSRYDDLAVVCYINSSAELKRHSDVCVTSANAAKVIKGLTNKHIFFIPDQHLGHYMAEQFPEKEFHFNNGCCPVHATCTVEDVQNQRNLHKNALFVVHPECPKAVRDLADYVGSTSGIIDFATKHDSKEYIIGTELGVFYELKKRNPDKQFYPLKEQFICHNMKKITLQKLVDVLEQESNEVVLSNIVIEEACKPLKRMLTLANKE